MRYILFLLLLPCILLADILPNINPPPSITDDQLKQVREDGDTDMDAPGRPGWQLTNGVWIYTDSFNNDPTIKGNFADIYNPAHFSNDFYMTSAQQTLPNGLNVTYTYAASVTPKDFAPSNPPIAITATYHNGLADEIDWNYTVSNGISTLSSIVSLGSTVFYVDGKPDSVIIKGQASAYSALNPYWKGLVDNGLANISQIADGLNTPPKTSSTPLPKVEVETNKIIQPTPQPLPKEKTIQDYTKHK